MSRFRIALYVDEATAKTVRGALVGSGFDRESVAVVTRDSPGVDYASVREVARLALHEPAEGSRGASGGLWLGAAFGALGGLLVVLGWLLLVPEQSGPGPIWTGGALFGGALTGALVGALVGVYLGVHYRRNANGAYLEAVRRGAAMVVVRAADEIEQTRAAASLRACTPMDLAAHRARWRDDDRAARLSRWRRRTKGKRLPNRPAFHGGTLAV